MCISITYHSLWQKIIYFDIVMITAMHTSNHVNDLFLYFKKLMVIINMVDQKYYIYHMWCHQSLFRPCISIKYIFFATPSNDPMWKDAIKALQINYKRKSYCQNKAFYILTFIVGAHVHTLVRLLLLSKYKCV